MRTTEGNVSQPSYSKELRNCKRLSARLSSTEGGRRQENKSGRGGWGNIHQPSDLSTLHSAQPPDRVPVPVPMVNSRH